MQVIVTDNFEETCSIAADIIATVIRHKPDARLGLATGSTAQGVYPFLVAANRRGELDFSRVNTINLDEYVGLLPDHPQSYRRFMDENLFDQINIDKNNTVVARGTGISKRTCRPFARRWLSKLVTAHSRTGTQPDFANKNGSHMKMRSRFFY